MNMTKSILAFLFALATVALVGGCRRPTAEDAVQPDARATAVVHRAQAATPVQKRETEILSAQALVRDFASDPAAAAVRFAHRDVQVTGKVRNLEAADDGLPVLTLDGGTNVIGARFVLDADAWSDISTVRTGATVSLSCRHASETTGRVTVTACALVRDRGTVALSGSRPLG